ncbi:speckle-type POZ protein-like A [Microplitis mediator]|uniref:speckle-type POZ protein-like A n=1 Tax=Microplitis mediator TaxID=375433 RepID=UPI0025548F1A|nr:speckle-type POZ protein-like A [Microplitis mediator]XP_057319046.1 speckle-type POZ protein-like A [Microplitis mediator]XP_057319047.1 speckle-type POZ protein-like A [Microplitis mediator]
MPLKKIERNVHTEYRTWKLENISETFAKVDTCKIDSSVGPVEETYFFSTNFQDHEIDWYVKLDFRFNELHSGFQIYFDAVEKLKPKNHVTCNFYLVDADENKFFIGRKNRKFDSTYCYGPAVGYSIIQNQAKLPNTKDKLLPNDTLTLLIELNIYLDENPIFPLEELFCQIEQVVNLDDISHLYPLKGDGDIEIYVQGVKFSVHKTVIEIRCPTLSKIIGDHQQMSDNNNNQLVVTDIMPEIFERVLEFIYTGKVKDLDDHAESLLEAASKYKLLGLKYMCELSLTNHYLTYESAEEVKKLAVRCVSLMLVINADSIISESCTSQMDFSCTRDGTLIITKPSGKKKVYKDRFKKPFPDGIKILPY